MLAASGSPPQVRGKRHFLASSNFRLGITPAGAGKTLLFANFRAFQWDHPRRCGENSILLKLHVAAEGSPPQVRGKLRARCRLHDINRITPAGAGKTLKQKRQYAVNEDHPRRCGENISDPACCSSIKGSPPQVRGKQRYFKHVPRKIRITPAGAGKTASLSRMLTAWWDHPRRCGENFIVLLAELAEMGSPPQVRGKQFSGVARG